MPMRWLSVSSFASVERDDVHILAGNASCGDDILQMVMKEGSSLKL
jgi:hypothetical protein